MANSTRIYTVSSAGIAIALVRAASQAAAIRHCTANLYSAEVADQEQLIKHMGAGLQVEDAAERPAAAGEAT